MDKEKRIEELVQMLNRASVAYYKGEEEVMPNYQWDEGLDELRRLEEETGLILPDSPTQTVGYKEEKGVKEKHEFPALSLNKTKSVEDLQKWAGNKDVWLTWKLDGLTLVLTYDKGQLVKILTRGDGTTGTNVSYMKDFIAGFPIEIPYVGHMVVRGEATISYADFEATNALIEDGEEKYSNPRNLASGTLSLDGENAHKAKDRHVTFNAFTLVDIERQMPSWGDRMNYLEELGFTVVARERVNAAGLPKAIQEWTQKVESGKMDIPVDGLVITYDDVEYAATGSVTGHHATRAGYAFKWQDESALTRLDHIEWSCATSVITPVAVFDPVQLEGTTVSRASLCNITELERLGIGADGKTEVEVIKANKIIPKIIGVKKAEGKCDVPAHCPVCGKNTRVQVSERSKVKTLICTNPDCAAKQLKKFVRFVGKDGLDIDGISIKSLQAFINRGFIRKLSDIFDLHLYAAEICAMEGFGPRSCEKLLKSIEQSRKVNAVNFIKSLSIPMIGRDAAKKIFSAVGFDGLLKTVSNPHGSFEKIQGIGPERSEALMAWFSNEENAKEFSRLTDILEIEVDKPLANAGGKCAGITFVITGDVYRYANRDAFKAYVESEGGKVAGSVSKKTQYLVNNDVCSASSKNQKAKSLNVPIISEDVFIKRFG